MVEIIIVIIIIIIIIISKQYNNLHQTVETILTYNVKVTHDTKISYIK